MLPKMFYRARFRKLAATYGARIELWPAYERAHARAFVTRHPKKAEADLALARSVDVWLDAKAPAGISEDSQWRAFGALVNARGYERLNRAVAEPEPKSESMAETITFEPAEAKSDTVLSGTGKTSTAALEIREERVRMVGRRKGILSFQ